MTLIVWINVRHIKGSDYSKFIINKKKMDRHLVNASRAMAYLLRHGAERVGIMIRSDGYMFVEDILEHRSLRKLGVGLEDV